MSKQSSCSLLHFGVADSTFHKKLFRHILSHVGAASAVAAKCQTKLEEERDIAKYAVWCLREVAKWRHKTWAEHFRVYIGAIGLLDTPQRSDFMWVRLTEIHLAFKCQQQFSVAPWRRWRGGRWRQGSRRRAALVGDLEPKTDKEGRRSPLNSRQADRPTKEVSH